MRFHFGVVHTDDTGHVAIDNFIADPELPLRKLAGVRATITGATMLSQCLDGPRRAVTLDVFRRRADNQMDRHEPARNRSARRWRPRPKSHVGTFGHEIREVIVELHFEL